MEKSNLTSHAIFKGEMLARFLNEADRPQKQRALDLLKRCRDLAEALPKLSCRPIRQGADSPAYDTYVLDSERRAKRLRTEINRQLARYRFRRVVEPVVFAEPGATPSIPVGTQNCDRPRLPKRPRRATTDEAGAVDMLLGLAEAGSLDRVRECPYCKQWFMARRKNQDHCKTEHSRENYYEQNKSKWPGYMRVSRERAKMTRRRQDLYNERLRLQKKRDLRSRQLLTTLDKEIEAINRWFKEKEGHHAKN
jgi:hypothetical protein